MGDRAMANEAAKALAEFAATHPDERYPGLREGVFYDALVEMCDGV